MAKSSKPVLVIIGAGSGGMTVATALEKSAHVILIDRRDHALHHIASPRAAVDGSMGFKLVAPYSKLLKKGHFIQGEVTEVQKDAVVLNGREQPIKFDYLLVATGYGNTFPGYRAEAFAKDVWPIFQESSKAIKEANNILVIGGGPVGCELLGEIKDKYPEKKVTLVHAHDQLINNGNFLPAFREQVATKIKALSDVTLILEDKVVLDDSLKSHSRFLSGARTVQTEKGKSIDTDLIFFTSGGKPSSGFLSKLFPEKVDSRGQVKVNKFLQVEGFENIFAVGDCTNIQETKQSITARGQANHAVKNILAHIKKQTLKEYPNGSVGMFLTLGSKKGVGQFLGSIWGNWTVSTIKGGSMFVGFFWSNMKLSVPSKFDPESFKVKPEEGKITSLSKILSITKEDAEVLLKGLPPIVESN